MINLVWSGLLTLLLLSGCGFDGTPTRTATDFLPLTSIEITAVSPTIAPGTSTLLKVNGFFSGLSTPIDITAQATWSSASPNVADFITTANPNRVTGKIAGPAILTATVKGVSSNFTITVSSATLTALTISPAAPSIAKGLTTQFVASGTFSDSTTQDLTFDAAWASSAPAVATVSDAAGSKGFAQTLAAGTATISATLGVVSGTTLLTVTVPVLQSITVTPANPSILSLSSGSFQATGHFSDGTTPDITSQVAWSSSNTAIATITTTGGSAKTLAQGTTSISATLPSVPGVSGATNLRVTGGNLTGFTVSPTTVTLVKGTVARLTATGTFNNGVTTVSRDITKLITWSPANTNFATVTTPGGNLALLNALAVTPFGTTTTITATVTAPSGTLTNATNPTTLTVTAPVLQTLVITTTNPNLIAGITTPFTATATFNDGSTQDVTTSATWSSNNSAIASVDNTTQLTRGRIRGVAAGTTTISATYGDVPFTSPPITVTVTAPALISLTLPAAVSVASGNQVPFTATANYNGTSQDVTTDTIWSIDNPNVAVLADSTNQPGQVVGVDSGTATLTATFGGKTQTTIVTVP
jgi:hypothetical protein